MTYDSDAVLGKIVVAHARLERWMMILMGLGLLAMFQPWFRGVAGWFDGLTDSGDASLVYREDIAPVVFRYGFFLLLASTLAFIIVGHYTPLMLREAFATKGKRLTYWLILVPLGYGFMLIVSLAYGYALGSLLGLVGAVAAIAVWNWRTWGVATIVVIGLAAILSFATGGYTWFGAATAAVFAAITVLLVYPHRDRFRGAESEAA